MRARRVSAFFELQDAASARWLPMEGLRGFAVALVFLVHFADFRKPYSDAGWLNALHEIGNVGVDLFFVLSGFLIYKACIRRPINVRLYAWRRIERIYPAFLAAFAIYLALMVLMPSQSKLPDEAGESRDQHQERKHGQHRRECQAAGLVAALVHDVVVDGQQDHAQARDGKRGEPDALPHF